MRLLWSTHFYDDCAHLLQFHQIGGQVKEAGGFGCGLSLYIFFILITLVLALLWYLGLAAGLLWLLREFGIID
jgi:hypothetical protein